LTIELHENVEVVPRVGDLWLPMPFTIELHENVEIVPRVGDLWLPMVVVSLHHKVMFFFSRIDVLFIIGDKVVKVEHARVESKVLVWSLGKKNGGKWLWNFEHEEKMKYEKHQLQKESTQ
jgi:hypothetical protein